MSDTTSTDNLFTQLRTRLLTFAPLAGATLMTRLGGTTLNNSRLWKDAPPDSALYPFGVMRIINRISEGRYNGEREQFDLEVILYGRPRSQAVSVEDAADVCDQAMLRYADGASGLTFSRERQRDSLPDLADPADREVVQVRLVYSAVVWPRMLTQYSS